MIEYHKPPFRLREFKIEVTRKCSLACIHCSSDANPESDEAISIDDCKKILSQAESIGGSEVAFSGGEPLLWSWIEDAVAYSNKLGIKTTVYTSGNVPNIETLLKSFSKHKVHSCVFSIFGGSASAHERVTRKRGSFEFTKRAIKLANQQNIVTEFHFVPLSTNYKDLVKIASLSREWGIKKISVLRFVPQGRGSLIKGRALSPTQNIELKRTIEQLRKESYVIRTGSPLNFLMVNDRPKCASGIDRLIIAPDLRVYPCDAFKNIRAEEIVDSVEFSSLSGESLKNCWEKSTYLRAIRKYLTTPFGDPCASCPDLEGCLSGCLAQKVLAYGNLEKRPDPMCMRRSQE